MSLRGAKRRSNLGRIGAGMSTSRPRPSAALTKFIAAVGRRKAPASRLRDAALWGAAGIPPPGLSLGGRAAACLHRRSNRPPNMRGRQPDRVRRRAKHSSGRKPGQPCNGRFHRRGRSPPRQCPEHIVVPPGPDHSQPPCIAPASNRVPRSAAACARAPALNAASWAAGDDDRLAALSAWASNRLKVPVTSNTGTSCVASLQATACPHISRR